MGITNMFHRRDLATMPGGRLSEPPGGRTDLSAPPEAGDKTYYYVGALYNGKVVVLGRYYSWEQAQLEGQKKLPCEFNIYPLTTGDMTKATKLVKYKLGDSQNIDAVLRNARHVGEEPEI